VSPKSGGGATWLCVNCATGFCAAKKDNGILQYATSDQASEEQTEEANKKKFRIEATAVNGGSGKTNYGVVHIFLTIGLRENQRMIRNQQDRDRERSPNYPATGHQKKMDNSTKRRLRKPSLVRSRGNL